MSRMRSPILLLAPAIFFCTLILRRCLLSPLYKHPGPFIASVSRLWYAYIKWRGTQYEVLVKMHAEYGDIIRVAPNEVCVQQLSSKAFT